MKLLILILSCEEELSHYLINEGIKKTWGSISIPNVKILDYYGDHDKNEIVGDSIYVVDPDIGVKEMYQKTLGAFEVALNNLEFDFLLRTNASTFIRQDLIYNILKKQVARDYCGSAYHSSSGRLTYPPGTSMIFSRDVIEKLVNMRYDDNPEAFVDDWGIGYLLRKIYPNYENEFERFDRIDLLGNMHQSILNDPIFKIKYGNNWAFRCKSDKGKRHLDVEKMKKIYELLY